MKVDHARRIVISGGSSGIGLVLAEHLLNEGHEVLICSRAEQNVASAISSLQQLTGHRCIGLSVDVTDFESVDRLHQFTRSNMGDIDTVIASAGILGPVGRIESIDTQDILDVFNVNVIGLLNLLRVFHSDLRRSGDGRVIGFSGGGLGGSKPMLRTPGYAASKAALATLVEVLSHELMDIGTKINCLAPGSIPTSFMKSIIDAGPEAAGAELFDEASSRSGPTRASHFPDLCKLVSFLLSAEAISISGRILSARWERPETLVTSHDFMADRDIYRLRRIDDDLFGH